YPYDMHDALQRIAPTRTPWHPITKKGQDFDSIFTYIGFVWDIERKCVSLSEPKRLKFGKFYLAPRGAGIPRVLNNIFLFGTSDSSHVPRRQALCRRVAVKSIAEKEHIKLLYKIWMEIKQAQINELDWYCVLQPNDWRSWDSADLSGHAVLRPSQSVNLILS
ncbi:hypothetical protein R3P38DRAFT_2541863, partial [Favolaschia claudopus]